MTNTTQPGEFPRLYTSAEAADLLGLSDAAVVRQNCIRLGIQRKGRDWLLTDADLDLLRNRPKPGRPVKENER